MIFTIFLLNIIGFLVWLVFCWLLEIPGMAGTQGIEFVNPAYLYKTIRVNWFGAIFLAIFYSAMCPIGAIGYWFYKLCTIGRE